VEEDLRVGLDGDLGVVGVFIGMGLGGNAKFWGSAERDVVFRGWIRGRVLLERWMGLEGRDGVGGWWR
jgi:hypothetical protein